MARLFTYIIITIGLLAFFSVAGIYQNNLLANLGLMPDDMNNQLSGELYTIVLLYIGMMIGTAAVSIGLFGSSFSDVPVTAAMATPLAYFIVTLASVSSSIDPTGSYGFINYVVWLIFAPLIAGYLISLYDWVRGRD